MTSDHAFGSNELTPDLLRGVQFEERDGMIPAGEVRTFLENAASALDVLLSQDGITAMKREIDRSADIATQVLDAGQTAAEQLRRQAAEEAKRILDEARDATLGLRATVDAEIEQAREQVEAMRGTFIQDLRDLYDRIGASLYRFERAAEESTVAPIKEPARDMAAGSGAGIDAGAPPRSGAQSATPAPSGDARVIDAADSTTGDADQDAADLPEGAKPPAWRQLPAEAWSAADDAEPAAAEPVTAAEPAIEPAAADPGPDAAPAAPPSPSAPRAGETTGLDTETGNPFAVVEDEPLAPGEPLVDLRDFATGADDDPSVEPDVAAPSVDAGAAATPPAQTTPAIDAPAAEPPAAEPSATEPPATDASGAEPSAGAGSWLDGGDASDLPPVAPQAAAPAADPAAAPDAAAPADPAGDAGGSWLDMPGGEPAAPAEADVARDDALAEALIAGTGSAPIGAPTPDAPSEVDPSSASPDAVAVRQQILDLLASGQSRESIETYLSQQLGLLNPGALIDAAISAQG